MSKIARRMQNQLPYLGKLTLSAGVITDTVRAAGVEGDGGDIGDGVGVWPAATNIATQSIPGALATTGVTKAGDAAATLTKVADSTHPFPNATADVWCLDNSAGSTNATVDFDGNATAAAHTASVWAYKTAGSPNLSIEGTSPTAISGATWARYTNTKTATAGDNLRITAPAGAVVYFVAAQLETGSLATPFILTDGGTASRVAGRIQIPVAGLFTANQGWVAVRWRSGWSVLPNAAPGLAVWADNVSTQIALRMSSTTAVQILDSTAGNTSRTVAAITSGSTNTSIAKWIPTDIGVSGQGSAFTMLGSRSGVPSIANSMLDIGSAEAASAGRPITGDIIWAATGVGTLTDADAALFHAWGNNDPLPHMFPSSARLSFLAHFNGDGTFYRRSA